MSQLGLGHQEAMEDGGGVGGRVRGRGGGGSRYLIRQDVLIVHAHALHFRK